ncbi:MAG: cobalt transporter CbiM [Anaerolineae bacterium]
MWAISVPSFVQGVVSGQPMHIPDGYLGPWFAIALWIVTIAILGVSAARFRRRLNQRMVPLVALLAAFSFVIMMFNVPLIGGTTGHAVGATIAAIILGPEGATIAVAIALVVQALFFGDGGIVAYGANVLLMGIVMPWAAWIVYRAIAGNAAVTSGRRLVAGAVAGWAALSLAAGLAGVFFGMQPILFHTADGTPLYAPFPLSIAVPAMLIPHMLIASVIEGAVTAGILAFLQRTNPAVLEMNNPSAPQTAGAVNYRPLWIGIAALVILSPIGLLAGGSAWGEWAADQIGDIVGFVPQGLANTQAWTAPLPDYGIEGLAPYVGYILSAALGILIVVAVVWGIGRLVARRTAAEKS